MVKVVFNYPGSAVQSNRQCTRKVEWTEMSGWCVKGRVDKLVVRPAVMDGSGTVALIKKAGGWAEDVKISSFVLCAQPCQSVGSTYLGGDEQISFICLLMKKISSWCHRWTVCSWFSLHFLLRLEVFFFFFVIKYHNPRCLTLSKHDYKSILTVQYVSPATF